MQSLYKLLACQYWFNKCLRRMNNQQTQFLSIWFPLHEPPVNFWNRTARLESTYPGNTSSLKRSLSFELQHCFGLLTILSHQHQPPQTLSSKMGNHTMIGHLRSKCLVLNVSYWPWFILLLLSKNTKSPRHNRLMNFKTPYEVWMGMNFWGCTKPANDFAQDAGTVQTFR